MSATVFKASGTAPGRLDFMGGVGDYSGSLVLQVATSSCFTTASAELELGAPGGDAAAPGSVELSSDSFGAAAPLSLAPLRAAPGGPAALDLAAVRAALEAAAAPGWARYAYGCVAAYARATGWLPPPGATLRVRLASSVPHGAGVSSSASVEVATMRALAALAAALAAAPPGGGGGGGGSARAPELSPLALAHAAQAAENYVVGAPCGLMDQLACSLGSPRHILPILCRPDAVAAAVPLPPSVAVVGWPSGVKHALSGAASPYLVARTASFMAKKALEAARGRPLAHLTELRPSELARAAAALPAALTGADFAARHGGVDDALSRVVPATAYPVGAAAAFPVAENFRCELALALLRGLAASRAAPGEPAYADALAAVGELMYQAHEGYSSVGLGCAETDAMVDAVRARLGRERGVWGARVSGGGNGGTVAVLCERAALPALEALARELTFGEPFPGFIE